VAKNCMECGKKKSWTAHNYAGMNLRNATLEHAYPDRIKEIILPGNSVKDFLCADCANKRKVTCSVHGVVGEKLWAGGIPTCSQCKLEKDEKGLALPVQWWKMSAEVKSGDGKALAWMAACHLLHAERVNIHRSVEHVLGGAEVCSYATWQASKLKALEFGKRALSVCHEEHGRTFCSFLVARAESLQSSRGTLKESKGMSSAIGPMAHYEYLPEEAAILGGEQTLDDLSQLVSEIPCCEWLVGFGGISKVGDDDSATRPPPCPAPSVANAEARNPVGTDPANAPPAPKKRRTVACPRCKGAIYANSLVEGENVCPNCRQKFRVVRRKQSETEQRAPADG